MASTWVKNSYVDENLQNEQTNVTIIFTGQGIAISYLYTIHWQKSLSKMLVTPKLKMLVT